MSYQKKECRMCGGTLTERLKLSPTPIANQFQEKPMTGTFYPLDLMECDTCKHVQTRHVLTGLFDDYKYKTPKTQSESLLDTAKKLKEKYPLAKNVLEIGANNGLNVHILNKVFDSVIGVDPAGEWPVWNMNFDIGVARLVGKHWGPDIIIANNVFAHIDNLDEVFEGIAYLLTGMNVLIMEFNYFPDMARDGRFDAIYHEHLDQHTLKPWVGFLAKYGLKIADYEDIPAHGGSVRVTVKRDSLLQFEEIPIDWDRYRQKITDNKKNLLSRLPEKFCIWGATAKATTLIWQTGIAGRIAYCVDNTPQKKDLYLPMTAIKIVPEFLDDLPVLLTAWNYEKEFKEQYPNREYILPYA